MKSFKKKHEKAILPSFIDYSYFRASKISWIVPFYKTIVQEGMWSQRKQNATCYQLIKLSSKIRMRAY